MLIKFNFPLEPNIAVKTVLEGLALSDRLKLVALMQVETEDETVAALLRTLPEAKEVFPPGTVVGFLASPPADHVVVTKPKRERAKRTYTSGPLVECKACHKQKPAAQMCKTGECKTCRMQGLKQEKLAEKSQPAKKSQVEKHPETWTNRRPEFGKEEAVSQIRDKPQVQVDLHKLAGRRVG